VAPLYRSDPVSAIPQPDYLNTVALARTGLSPEALLALAQGIESELGRRRTVRDAPRTIDVDLLFVGDLERRGERLVLPHPRLRERRFVLAPLADVAPGLALPPDGATAAELLSRLPERPRARRADGPDGSP